MEKLKQIEMIEDESYKAFVDKFKPKKTTDDCYTPDNIYEAIKDWAVREYHLEGYEIMRPFYPGGDYENENYTDNTVVIDNPPFSIITKIARFYNENNIKYFLFAPALMLFNIAAGGCNYIHTHNEIEYENGANIKTSFVTNMGEWKIDTAPELHRLVDEQNRINLKKKKKSFPKYTYPSNVLGVKDGKLSARGQRLRIKEDECCFIRGLDNQRRYGKSLFGSGFLLSDNAAARREAAEQAAAEQAAAEQAAAEQAAKKRTVWQLSEREKRIVEQMSRKQTHL